MWVTESFAGGVRFNNTTIAQVFDIAMAWLDDHPEERPRPAAKLVGLALAEAWPCNQGRLGRTSLQSRARIICAKGCHSFRANAIFPNPASSSPSSLLDGLFDLLRCAFVDELLRGPAFDGKD
ncbi:Rap1a/Tai family immunity protein [Mesorhizobium sp. INR15]|uniref:Rap1a/Tai family immunity protein n=1 Tax=Mesorhizobium sp. INR15 TaxID=2654248 RepID=UPI001CA4BFF3